MGCGMHISEDCIVVELYSSGKMYDGDEGIFFEKTLKFIFF